MRVIKLALAATASLVVGLALAAGPALAADESTPSVSDGNGRVVHTFESTHRDGYTIQVAVDTHYGFLIVGGSPEDNPSVTRGVVRVTKGTGALRVQVDNIRVGNVTDSDSVNDQRPNREFLTPALAVNSGTASSVRAFSDFHDADTSDDYPDLVSVGDDGLVAPDTFAFDQSDSLATRGFVSVRWADGNLDRFNLRTGLSTAASAS